MKKAIRFDQGSLRKPERTPQGFLKVDGLVARCGVLTYVNPDGSLRRELRRPEDVFRTDSLAAFEGVSITDGHPTVLVDASNVRTLESGTVTGAARRDGDWVVAPMVIKDPKLIAKIESGKTGLSAGYTIREDWTPGVHPEYGPYDLIQLEIGPNHVAGAVMVPRAGDGARIRMDDMDMECSVELVVMTSAEDGHQHTLDPSGTAGCTSYALADGAEDPHKHEWIRLADGSITIAENAGHAHTVDNSTIGVRTDAQIDRSGASGERHLTQGDHMDKDEQIRLLQAQLAEANTRATKADADLKVRTDERDAAAGKLAVAETLAKDAQTRLDSGLAVAETEKVKELTGQVNAANLKIQELESGIPEQVRKRATLVSKAAAILGSEFRMDSLDDRSILEAGVRRFEPKADVTKESVAGLQARFDAFYDARAATAASTARIGAALAVRTDAQPTEVDPFDPLHNGVGQFASPHAAKKGA